MLRAGLGEGLGYLKKLPTNAGRGLIPDGPDFFLSRPAHQKARGSRLQSFCKQLKGFLGISSLASLQHGQVAGGHVDPAGELFEG